MCEATPVTSSPLSFYPGHEDLRNPVLLLAYAGWSDGGDAATSALRHLLVELSVSRYACLDTEQFLDFTVVRPHAQLRGDGSREIVWPNHEFFAARLAGQESDLVLGLGVEPHLRWKTYARSVVELAESRRRGISAVAPAGVGNEQCGVPQVLMTRVEEQGRRGHGRSFAHGGGPRPR